MKKAILFLFMLVAATNAIRGQISYGNPNDWFVTVWDMSKPTSRTNDNPASTIAVPLIGTNYTLYWEDMNNTSVNGIENVNISLGGFQPYYLTVPSGTTKVRIKAYKGAGTLTGISHPQNTLTDPKRLILIEQWGTSVWDTFSYGFRACENMDLTAIDIPNLSVCQNVELMFYGCVNLVNDNSSISSWQTQNINNMAGMFAGAEKFNKPLNWNTVNVQTMAWMFSGAVAFNQPINFDTRNVLDMGHMFVGASAFNSPFGSNWNTEKVTNMESMFRDATVFDQPIGNWNTSQVIDMKRMFEMARFFNQDISGWNTEKVKNMGGMFNGAVAFNQPIGGWNTQSLESTYAMFWGATSFNKPLNWNTQSLMDMYGMFCGATSFNSPLTFSSTANVTNMMNMFNGATSFNQRLTFNTQSVTNMSAMFYNAHSFNNYLNFSNTQNVTTTAAMFYNALAFNKFLGYWNLRNVTDMSFMFQGAISYNQPITFSTQNVTNLKGMFSGAVSFNQRIESSFNTQNVTDMSYMFEGATSFNQSISFYTGNVTDMKHMFKDASSFSANWLQFSIQNITDMTDMFQGCGIGCEFLSTTLNHWLNQANSLGKNSIPLGNLNADQYYNATGQSAIAGLQGRGWIINGGTFAANCILPTPIPANEWFVTVWDMSKPSSRGNYFNPAPSQSIAFPGIGSGYTIYWEDINNPTVNGTIVTNPTVTNITYIQVPSSTAKYRIKAHKGTGLFYGIYTSPQWSYYDYNKYDHNRLIAVEQWGTTLWSSLQCAFSNCHNMDMTATDKPNLSICRDLSWMFSSCINLVNSNGSISGWDVSKVMNMNGMFSNDTSFNQPLNSWDVSKVMDMNDMFAGATTFNQPLNNWNTENVTSMSNMFYRTREFNQSLNSWNTGKVTNMSGMFYNAISFNQPLTFNTQNVTDMQKMFQGAMTFNSALNFNTQNVTRMDEMFQGATVFNQQIGGWNISKVTSMRYMFGQATAFNQSIGNWNTANVTDMSGMFQGATAFNQPLNNWNTANVTHMYQMFQGATAFNQPLNNWNTGNVSYMNQMFANISYSNGNMSFNQDLSSWDVSKVVNLSYMFHQNIAFNGNVNNWGNKVRNVTDISYMFNGATSFNQSLGDWVLSSVNDSKLAFMGSGMSCTNLNATLEGWQSNSAFDPSANSTTVEVDFSYVPYSFKARNLIKQLGISKGIKILSTAELYYPYCDGRRMYEYTIEVDSRSDATGVATPANRVINTNVVGTNFSATYTEVGNPSNTGTVVGLNTGSAITLPSPGIYTIAIYAPAGGSITALSTTTAPLTNGYITNVTMWGTTKWQSLKDAFKGCSGLAHISAADVPNLSECTSLEAMFQNCTRLTAVPSIEDWNLSNVTTLKSMFAGATVYNQPLNNLDVSHIADFSGMFSGSIAFNYPLGRWNLSSITDSNTAMLNIFDNSGLGCSTYAETLEGWNMNQSTPNNIRLGVANVSYGNNVVTARNNLQTSKGWIFMGDLLSAGCDGADASGRYITVWDTRIPTTNATPLDIVTNIVGSNVTIDWEEVGNTSNQGTLPGLSGTVGNPVRVTGLPHAGVYRLKATITTDPALNMSMSGSDKERLLYVEQWGTTPWKSLYGAFGGAKNMRVVATDIPDFTQFDGNMQGMFQNCSLLAYIPNINSWNMSKAILMGPSGWDDGGMFQGAIIFNQDISGWDVSNVTTMSGMFADAKLFNQDISGWDVSNVTTMSNMFKGASSFNQPIGLWGNKMSNMEDITGLFVGATSFDQNLGSWTLHDGVTGWEIFSGSGMGCENYSATLVGWAEKSFVFESHFNLGTGLIPLNVAGKAACSILTNRGAYHLLSSSTINLIPDCKVNFYETTWLSSQQYPIIIPINAIGTNFTVAWEFIGENRPNGSGIDTAANASIGSPYKVQVNNNDGGLVKVRVFPGNGTLTGLHMRGVDPSKLISIDHWGDNKWQRLDSAFAGCSRMELKATDAPDLSEVIGTAGLKAMFASCSNMTDTQDKIGTWNVSNIKNMGWMFFGTAIFNRNINDWNVSNVTDMSGMFNCAYSFNKPLGNWDVSHVVDMSNMFGAAEDFNQPIGSWNIGSVTRIVGIFESAKSFNQPLNNWNVSHVTNMANMFNGAISFNQPLDRWDVRNVTDMMTMFERATSFDQSLGKWKPIACTNMSGLFRNAGISCGNYSGTLYGWAENSALLKPNVRMIYQDGMSYNRRGQYARNKLIADKGWDFSNDIQDLTCGSGMAFLTDYVSEWDLSQPAQGTRPDAATTLKTNLWGTNFVVEWLNLDDNTTGAAIATATTVPYTITGLTAGKRYRVIAYADPSNPSSTLSGLSATSSDTLRLTQVNQWGTNKWQFLSHAFYSCGNMNITATDVPDLYGLAPGNKELSYMFKGCKNLVYNPTIDTWRTDSITSMNCMFQGAKVFNQPIGSWNTAKVTNMNSMFSGAEVFNQDISGWNTANVTDMIAVFFGAKAFNKPIGSWNTAKVTNMYIMFYGAEAFNQDISGWNTANVTDMYAMFANTKFFNQPIGSWNTAKVTNMGAMFYNAKAFDQDLSRWKLISVTDIDSMFNAPLNKGMSCKNYSKTLQSWSLYPYTMANLNFSGQLNRQYNIMGKEARDILTKPVAQGGKGWTITGDTYDRDCGIEYVWTGNASTDITNAGNWQGGRVPTTSPTLGEFNDIVAFDRMAQNDMHIPSLPYTTPGSSPNVIPFYSFGALINESGKKLVVEPNAHLYIGGMVFGSDSAHKVDKIVIKADNTRPNGTLILAGQPCDKPVYATVEMYSKAYKSATPLSWTDNIPGSPTNGQSMSASYKWQYIGVPVDGEVANAFYGSYVRKYDETLNDPTHFYGKWRKIGADETWQPLVPFAGYEVTSRTPKVYVFKGRLLHCPQELTLTRRAAEVTAYAGTDILKKYYGLGQNLFGNSYTAALNISNGKFFVDLEASYAIGREPIEATVYIYNTGSVADWNGGSTGSGAGQYVSVPMRNATLLSEQFISSMQGFMLKFKEDTLRINGVGNPVKFRIGLTKGDFTNTYPFGGNQQPQRAPQADPSDKIHGFLKIGLTSRRSVSSVHLVEAEGTTDEFDNGWDGMQLNTGRSSSATLFVPSAYGDLQVSTSDNIVGDRFGIVNNGDTTYRLTVIRHRLDNRGDLYLYDVATNRYTLLDADTTVYDFTSEGSGNVDKRFVITDRRNADDPNTAVDEAADDLSLYGYIDGRNTLVVNNHTAEAGTLTLLDVSGKAVYTSRFGVGFSRHDLSHLPAGVYIARLEASVRRATVKAITMK